MRRLLPLLVVLLGAGAAAQDPVWNRERRRTVEELAARWWKARPATRFTSWDAEVRRRLEEEARALGAIPEGSLPEVVEALWEPVRRYGPRARGSGKCTIETPYGKAWFYCKGRGRDRGLLIGLHGGGEGAGSADGAASKWPPSGCIAMYPQGIRLVHDTWNTVHGERFILTLMEIGKAQHQVDPDRIYVVGFSMGGTGSWYMAGRHPDWLAGAAPCAGVLMARPKSQLASKEEVRSVQHGLVPNVRNLAMRYFIGLEDRNCMPGTYLFVQDMLDELRTRDPEGYRNIHFKVYPDLGHSFPPKEPQATLKFLMKQKRDTFPEELVWEYATRPFPRAPEDSPVDRIQKHHYYWLHCKRLVDRQEIRARIQGNTIHLEAWGTASGVKGITVFLNPAMIDPAEEVVVLADGEEVYRGRPVPDLWTVMQTMDARLDRKMVFDRRIEL